MGDHRSQPSNINLSLLAGETAVWYCAKTSMNLQQPAPLIPPVHPDVQMKPLPFYDVLDVLIKPSSLGASTAQRYHQEKYFIFALTPQQVREVCISRDFLPGGRRDYMVQIQLRFCLAETSCPQDDNFPNSLCIKVNGKLFPLPGFAPPPKNGVEQKRTGRPLNITSLVRLSSAVPNQISVTWTQEMGKTYSLSVYLVRQLTSPLLLQRLRMKGIRSPDHSRALNVCLPGLVHAPPPHHLTFTALHKPPQHTLTHHNLASNRESGPSAIEKLLDAGVKEKLTADPDSEIATTSLRVSLMCPLGKMRLTVPCRAVTCSHLQCFDAALYLQMNEKKPTWICPVCDKKADYENLIIDGLFLEILNDCSDVDEIKFQEDGTWCPMRPKKDPVKFSVHSVGKVESTTPLHQSSVVAHPLEPNLNKKTDVIDLTLESSSSSDDDDDDDTRTTPPSKRQCIYISKNEEIHAKSVLTYQPSLRMPNVPGLEQSYLTSAIAEYAVPFRPSTLGSIPTELQSLDLFSLIPTDPQHYRPQMFLENLSGSLHSIPSTSSGLVSSTSSSNFNSSGHTATSIHSTPVVTGGSTGEVTGGSLSDIISLD